MTLLLVTGCSPVIDRSAMPDGNDTQSGLEIDSGLKPTKQAEQVAESPATETGRDDRSGRIELFPKADFLRERIPDDPRIDLRSKQIIEGLNQPGDPASAMLVDYGIPIYVAGPDTPLVEISCTDTGRGVCGPERLSPIRMPAGATPNDGSDGALVIVDTIGRTTHELWRASEQADGSWTAQWGSSNDIDGDAIAENGGSGSGVSRLGGVITVDELAAGTIPHALAIASSATCAQAWRAPAWTTDGRTESDDCIEMGSRLQLDPSIDLDSLSLTTAERMVGEALQVYGGYIVDSSASELALFVEREDEARNGEIGPVAEMIGFRWDYDPLSGLPWDRLRVIDAAVT
ncbi:MAG: hypothetical protein ABJH68_00055 [Ilumatobacter sp.]